MDITKIAYEKYRLDWMIRHNHTLTELMEFMEVAQLDAPTAFARVLFSYWESNCGFDGELWACYDEFMQTEFLNVAYMENILTNTEFDVYVEWLASQEPEEEPEQDDSYILCYDGAWESVIGEDAMQIRVDELAKELDCDPEDILVFHTDSKL